MATTPNMLIPIDVPGSTAGAPSYQWAVDNESFKLIVDAHAHLGTPGSGVQITTAALNINADLSFNNGGTPVNATNLRSVRLSNNSSPLAVGTDLGCVYESGGNLYYNNSAGTQIRLTNGSSIDVSTSGGITGMPGTTAAVTYSSGLTTFVFTSDTAKSASLDAGNVTIRQPGTASAKGVTLKSPTSLAADYIVNFPAALPAAITMMTMDASGNIAVAASPTTTAITASNGFTAPAIATGTATTPPASGLTVYTDSTLGKLSAKNSSAVGYPVYAAVTNTASMASFNTTEKVVAGGILAGNNSPVSSFQIPANMLRVGSIVRFSVWGTCTSTVANTTTLRIRAGTNGTTADTAVTTFPAITATTGGAAQFKIVVEACVTVIGASATLINANFLCTSASASAGIAAALVTQNGESASASFDSTAAKYISLCMVSSAATTSYGVTGGMAELL